MKSTHFFLVGLGLCLTTFSAFATNDKLSNNLKDLDQETCTIKKPTCATDSSKANHPGDLSDPHQKRELSSEFSIYQQWKTKLIRNAATPIYVEDPMTASKETFETYLITSLDKVKKKEKDKKAAGLLDLLKEIIQSQKNYLAIIKAMPLSQNIFAIENLPLSRFRLKSEVYSEKSLEHLKQIFPQDLKTEHDLTEEQKQAFVQYGAIAILAAQGLALNIQAQSKGHSEPLH